MLIDLLNSSNYIMINRDAVKILGLNTAAYCSELLNIYKKALQKKKFYDNKWFKVDRDYIKNQTSLSLEDQLKCDVNLSKVKIIELNSEDPDMIDFNVEVYASILSSEDVKLLDSISEKVKKNVKSSKQTQRDRIIVNLKESIQCRNYDVLTGLRNWIDSMMQDPKNYLSTQQVSLFKDTLDRYCDGNVKLALELINIAIAHNYRDCQWAINTYEKNKNMAATITRSLPQRQTSVSELGKEMF